MNKKILVLAFLVIFSLMISTFVPARPNTISDNRAHISVPKYAVEVTPRVFSLGKAIDKGVVVEGFMIFHDKEENAKSSFARMNIQKAFDVSSCYSFLATGAKWRTVEPWIVNPANNRGLDGNFILADLDSDISKWESVAGKNILGDGSVTSNNLVADTVSPDNKNEIFFANIDYPGAIAVTIVWGTFNAPINQRQIVEWDQVYDDVDFDWSAIGETGKMDFENIATHELGHSMGLNDLYNTRCSEQTMYGYASNGETNKRSLESGDIKGIKTLYR